LVVDPVLMATSGATLARSSLLKVLLNELMPMATVVTPNLDEAAVLLGWKAIRDVEGMRAAAREFQRRFGCAALVKGGHLRASRSAVDLLYDGRDEFLLEAPFVAGVSTHGTGCTYAAAITAGLARGDKLVRSVRLAKEYITQTIARSYAIGRHEALGHFPE